MADERISQLTSLAKAAMASGDLLPIVDVSASETKKGTLADIVGAGVDLLPSGSIDLGKLNQSSTTKLGAAAIGSGAITAVKLANDSTVAVQTTVPSGDNFEGRGFFNSSTGNIQFFNGSAYQQVVLSTSGIADGAITAPKIADDTITTAKIVSSGLGTAAFANQSVTAAKIASGTITGGQIASATIGSGNIVAGAIGTNELANAGVTFAKIQNVATNTLLGRSTAGSGAVESITLTAAGRALLDDADAAAQRATLGLGNLALASGTWTNGSSFSGTSTGTNTGDQTITLTGDVTGTGSGTFSVSIVNGSVTTVKLAANSVTTDRIVDDAVTAAKLGNNSSTIVSTAAPTGSGSFIGQHHFNQNTGIEYVYLGANSWAATSGVAGLPVASGTSSGIVAAGSGLVVINGVMNHSNAVSGRTVNGFAFDNQGHITSATDDQRPSVFYVRSDGSNSKDGRSPQTGFRHIEHALSQIPSGTPWTVVLLDSLTTNGELDVPDYTTIMGINFQRRTVITPTAGSGVANVFRCGNGVHLLNMKFTGWQIDDFANPTKGFAMTFRPGAIILPGGVPYGQNCVVTSSVADVPTPLPMDAANGNPAFPKGGGCVLADASVLSAYSVFPNIMTWGFTPASPNGIGYVSKNRGLVNPVNAIGVGAHIHFMAVNGGRMVVSSSSSQFGDYSFWASGSTTQISPLKISAGQITTQANAASIVAANKTTIVNAVWSLMVASYGGGSWPAGYETFTRKDTGLLLDAIAASLVHGFERPMLNFAEGMFGFDGVCVYTYAYHAAFKAAWDKVASDLVGTGQFTAGAVTMINALKNRLKATLDNYWYEAGAGPAPSPVEPVKRKFRSEITAINHQWTAPMEGVEYYRVPPARTARAIRRSIIQKNGGRVIFSGQDDTGNALFVGGLGIDARSGELIGPPLETVIRGRVSRAIIARSY